MPVFRLFRIALEAFRFGLRSALRRLHLLRSGPDSPQQLCVVLARLGTTFIKFGQALSIRRDMLPDNYIVALQSLQEHVAPFPVQDAIQEIERGLGRSIDQIFSHLDHEPLAAASVAQVHAARLHDGQNVIVKVRRPGIKLLIDQDMLAVKLLARGFVDDILNRIKSKSVWTKLNKLLSDNFELLH